MMPLITQQNKKLVNLNYNINNFIKKIPKSKYLCQDAGDDLKFNHYHCIKIRWFAAQFDYTLREIGNGVCGCQ